MVPMRYLATLDKWKVGSDGMGIVGVGRRGDHDCLIERVTECEKGDGRCWIREDESEQRPCCDMPLQVSTDSKGGWTYLISRHSPFIDSDSLCEPSDLLVQ